MEAIKGIRKNGRALVASFFVFTSAGNAFAGPTTMESTREAERAQSINDSDAELGTVRYCKEMRIQETPKIRRGGTLSPKIRADLHELCPVLLKELDVLKASVRTPQQPKKK